MTDHAAVIRKAILKHDYSTWRQMKTGQQEALDALDAFLAERDAERKARHAAEELNAEEVVRVRENWQAQVASLEAERDAAVKWRLLNQRKVDAYDEARAVVKREPQARAEYVLRAEAAEATLTRYRDVDAATRRVAAAMVRRYGAAQSEETEAQARVLACAALDDPKLAPAEAGTSSAVAESSVETRMPGASPLPDA